jgi:hypothetical protein
MAAGPCLGATLIADYPLTSDFNSVVAGAAPLVPINNVTFTSGLVYGHNRTVAAFQQGSGVRLDPPAGFAATGYSIVLQFEFALTTGYRKIVDFQDLTLDEGLYNLNALLDFYPVAAGTTQVIQAGAFGQVVLTRSAAGTVVGYVNGFPQFTFDDSTTNYAVLLSNSFNLFVDDTHTGGTEASAGMVSRVRLYSGVLTAIEVRDLDGNPCGSPDFNGDGASGTDADIEAFFACLAGNCCPTCGSADFNGDGSVATDADIEAFFRVLAGGSC